VRVLSIALLIILGSYALSMGIWSTSLKYLDLSNHNMQQGWATLERFAPSNGIAYALMGIAAAAILGVWLTNPAHS